MITKIDAYPLAYPEPHYRGVERCVTIVRVEDESGEVGWGEGISQFPEASRATCTIVAEGLGPLVIGERAEDVERIWEEMCAHAYWYGVEGIAAFAISAIDMALWDLKGKLLGSPVIDLLGSAVRTRVPAMASIIFDMEDLDWTLAEFNSFKAEGFKIVKAGWGMTRESVFGLEPERDFTYLTEIRDVIGTDISLVVDVPGARRIWDVTTAIRRFNEWEQFDLRWIEQPLHPSDLEGHARLRSSSTTPVGTGEDEWSPESYRRLIDSRGVDVIQIDPGRCLGITGSRKVVGMVEAARLKYSAHSWSSGLNTAASLSLIALSHHGDTLDFKPHASPMQHDLIDDPWVQVDGYLDLRSKPGLGVSVNEQAIAKYLSR